MKSFLGSRIRERRRQLRLAQAELARRIEISPSYLNLIEHNKRNIGGRLLVSVAKELNLDPDELDGAKGRRLLSELEGIANIPLIATLDLNTNHAGELIGRYPGWAQAISELAKSQQEVMETARSLADRLLHDSFLKDSIYRVLTAIASIRSSIEILIEYKDISPEQRINFQNIIYEETKALTQIGEALATYFDKDDLAEKVLTPMDEVELLFKSCQNRFEDIEKLINQFIKLNKLSAPLNFEQARQITENEFGELIKDFINKQPQIETELAQSKAMDALICYSALALCLPSPAFESTAMEMNFDIEQLSDSFSLPIELIFQRLTALPRRSDLPKFGYFLVNASGTIISLYSIEGLISPRYATACPLWILYRAQQTPETLLRQRVIFPTGDRYVFIARARPYGLTGFGKPKHYLTDMLVMHEEDAVKTIYSVDDSVAIEKVGSTCRNCPRKACQHRVIDPLTG